MNDGVSIESLDFVEAPLLYLSTPGQVPDPRPGAGASDWPGRWAFHPMRVYDARPIVDHLRLDSQGFILIKRPTNVVNFYDEREVRTIYYPEVETLVKRISGAAKTLVFAHDVRCMSKAKDGATGVRAPVPAVHNDYTYKSGPQMVREALDPVEAEMRLSQRFVEVNVWRPIRGPVRRTPLAVCDARTITPADLMTMDLKHEVYVVAHSARHRWFYFSQMQSDEVLILKCFDSAAEGRARFTAHAAFEDPSAPPDAPDRESIEARVLVFFA